MNRFRSLGVATGAAQFASADILSRMSAASRRPGAERPFDLLLEPRTWQGAAAPDVVDAQFKIHVFDTMRGFEKRGVDAIVLPCFLSHTFIDELAANLTVPVANIMTALSAHVRRSYPSARRIGVLTSAAIRENGLFERYFEAGAFEVCYPRDTTGVDCVTSAVYGDDGIRSGRLYGRPVELLRAACADLIAQGVDVIVPGLAEIGLVLRALGRVEVPFVDTNQVYARYVAAAQYTRPAPSFRLGVVGGIGPAAGVDFLGKLVRNTPAARDQDHLKVLVEQNPQIPDRTAALLGSGDDPTLALYAACKALEERGANLIALPCNTAHAFVERIEAALRVPIVNMLSCTADYLRDSFPDLREVGVLATSGTLASRVYEQAFDVRGFVQIAPSAAAQARLMNAIYGPHGAKAGYTSGECCDDLAAALDDLVAQGVQVIVLACTELPLLLREAAIACPGGRVVRLVDPTDVLARRCVAYALGDRAAWQPTRKSAAECTVAPAAGRARVESAVG
ncbi:cysteate racemase [Paraburkholderia antibiotica]|uniref:Aspartate/glutamate racemase family protein n=1 Tax=Paraburkholderia antibiotica TaxID=2728839 RepID=A0A7Y0FG70_9BURK|nr:amino acid racemase [Paraburkholderia antibiotica]NML34847.1 aspartate/glutamate racemase family protein [Paraburkholderia antibiotica]